MINDINSKIDNYKPVNEKKAEKFSYDVKKNHSNKEGSVEDRKNTKMYPISVSISEIVIDVKFVHLWKVSLPIEVIEFGIIISVKL